MTYIVLAHPFFLIRMLVVSWAVTVPLQDMEGTKDIYTEEQLQDFLEKNPSLVSQLRPDLLRKASEVLLIVDPEVMVEMFRRKEATFTQEELLETTQEGTREDKEDKHDRKKRQATFGFSMNRR